MWGARTQLQSLLCRFWSLCAASRTRRVEGAKNNTKRTNVYQLHVSQLRFFVRVEDPLSLKFFCASCISCCELGAKGWTYISKQSARADRAKHEGWGTRQHDVVSTHTLTTNLQSRREARQGLCVQPHCNGVHSHQVFLYTGTVASWRFR